jgi:hypothetical protein
MTETTVSTANRWTEALSVVYIVSPRFLSGVGVWRKTRKKVAKRAPRQIK